ncbi:hypothetical protein Rsub_03021 [Raphidocelis subcapitata]|uniref:Uncharacterized protein n=1 Tax=Raphidocelis subcapitata TaxID=307507 RepID=A0A2V0NYQ3_9CHLO|nr:hypothetical protein Rsub_03021 [Raphidocelis subcapitata]|eukprot:GBF90720.1 hypothetical protein Rsub_03021 [Raphidocelis subcapitata]
MTPPPTCTADDDAEARAAAAATAQAAVEKLTGPELCHNIVAAALAKAVENYNKAEAARAAPPKRGASASALAGRAKAAILERGKALLQRVKSVKGIKQQPKSPKPPQTPQTPKSPKSIEKPESLPKSPTNPEAPKRTASAGAQLASRAKALFKSTKPPSLAKRSADAEVAAAADGAAAVVVEVAIAAPKSGSSLPLL